MTHVTDEDMVMHYYGEADGLPQTGPHMAECEECRHRFDELSSSPLRRWNRTRCSSSSRPSADNSASPISRTSAAHLKLHKRRPPHLH